jgi:hypothetical protein
MRQNHWRNSCHSWVEDHTTDTHTRDLLNFKEMQRAEALELIQAIRWELSTPVSDCAEHNIRESIKGFYRRYPELE